ncbi:hypothetical protein I551_8902, partial [Mycobacterium ulcerans str. Harvey]
MSVARWKSGRKPVAATAVEERDGRGRGYRKVTLLAHGGTKSRLADISTTNQVSNSRSAIICRTCGVV